MVSVNSICVVLAIANELFVSLCLKSPGKCFPVNLCCPGMF